MPSEWEFNYQTKGKGAVIFFTFEATKEDEKDTPFQLVRVLKCEFSGNNSNSSHRIFVSVLKLCKEAWAVTQCQISPLTQSLSHHNLMFSGSCSYRVKKALTEESSMQQGLLSYVLKAEKLYSFGFCCCLSVRLCCKPSSVELQSLFYPLESDAQSRAHPCLSLIDVPWTEHFVPCGIQV